MGVLDKKLHQSADNVYDKLIDKYSEVDDRLEKERQQRIKDDKRRWTKELLGDREFITLENVVFNLRLDFYDTALIFIKGGCEKVEVMKKYRAHKANQLEKKRAAEQERIEKEKKEKELKQKYEQYKERFETLEPIRKFHLKYKKSLDLTSTGFNWSVVKENEYLQIRDFIERYENDQRYRSMRCVGFQNHVDIGAAAQQQSLNHLQVQQLQAAQSRRQGQSGLAQWLTGGGLL
jgi:hypothetical protein